MSKNNLVIGINSGTSFDGVDAALVEFKNNNFRFIKGISFDYPKTVKEKLRKLINNNSNTSLKEISQLNFLLGEVFADAALKLIKNSKVNPKNILLIANHGQTVFHHPDIETIGNYKIKSTLQIGESSVISKKTGIKTISNFREGDVAVHGDGAPLMPFLDSEVFGRSKNIKGILNIGGISNISIVGKNITPIAFDIGPGNALIDLISKKYFNKDYDKNGLFAKKGKVNLKAVDKALKDPYFQSKPPKSTGKEYFNERFVRKYFSSVKNKYDLMATLTSFTGECIEQALYDFVFPKYDLNEIVISGGGLKNNVLISHLQSLLPDIRYSSSDEYHLPHQYKEAILFALLGYTCHLQIQNNIPSSTGAKKRVILGKISYGA